MTAYTVAQLLKYKGNHELDIIVIDNKPDGSIKYLEPFSEHLTIVEYPKEKLQSHGIAYDLAIPHIQTEYFITLESDSFPTKNNWLNYYEGLVRIGYDCAGSLLKLSGGQFIHPAGGLYRQSVWQECKDYVDTIEYVYFPNMSRKEGFDAHLMVHRSIMNKFLESPEDYIDLADNYKPYAQEKALDKMDHYKPVGEGVFHNGMGGREESVRTYGDRTMDSETPFAVLNNKRKLINRIGLEPGQNFSYWQNAVEKKILYIPTEIKWISGREGQQQEYTLNEAGIKHLWGISAYKDVDPNDEVAKIKQLLPEELYGTLPENQKI